MPKKKQEKKRSWEKGLNTLLNTNLDTSHICLAMEMLTQKYKFSCVKT
jgi:hypothetical protein